MTTHNGRCGVQLVRGGTVDLREGAVSHNPIGVNVQTEGVDLSRLQDQADYVDNGINLDSSLLPVPAPLERLDP